MQFLTCLHIDCRSSSKEPNNECSSYNLNRWIKDGGSTPPSVGGPRNIQISSEEIARRMEEVEHHRMMAVSLYDETGRESPAETSSVFGKTGGKNPINGACRETVEHNSSTCSCRNDKRERSRQGTRSLESKANQRTDGMKFL